MHDQNVHAFIYMDRAINDGMLPVFNLNPNTALMHDNATPHTAFVTRNQLQYVVLSVLPWLSKVSRS